MTRPEAAVSEGSGNGYRSYYGQPLIKEPTWTWEIPLYLFAGGLAGASSGLALGASLGGNEKLARAARLISLAGASASPVLLVMDLGRPERFYNMLRVFKPTSPMSVGTWILSSFGPAAGASAVSDLFGVLPKAGRAAEIAAALLGPALATYTAVLFADTSVPVWHEARRELPLVFAGSSAASAGAAALLFVPPEKAGPARRLLICGAALEVASSEVMKRRLGSLLAEPYAKEDAGRYEKLSAALTVGGTAIATVFGRKSRKAAVLGGTLALGGAVAKRWSVFKAGFQSARDPKYTVVPQRDRLRAGDDARAGEKG